ncbi:MAG: hydroxymethylbilane synthase [Oscillospiraceae bacterium]|jgi:hydroxymethylbilane synthase|nr:hydroxymethylbilane synthase [Oscillospiraceae bacterium]
MTEHRTIRIGTRGSQLALAQTEMVIQALQRSFPHMVAEKVVLCTIGDRVHNKPLAAFGGQGIFVAEFEDALRDGRIDLAVHSAKDMPMKLGDGMEIAGVLPRGDPHDLLAVRRSTDLGAWTNPVIGTGSPRRQFQAETLFPTASFADMRGNIPTRLQKLLDGAYDGIILAAAGVQRLHFEKDTRFCFHNFNTEQMLPAGGQGVIAVECCADSEAAARMRVVSDRRTMDELETERRVLSLLNAGCHEAIGAFAQVQGSDIQLTVKRALEGRVLFRQDSAPVGERLQLAEKLAEDIAAEGKIWESSI